jgi:hypothetical protein
MAHVDIGLTGARDILANTVVTTTNDVHEVGASTKTIQVDVSDLLSPLTFTSGITEIVSSSLEIEAGIGAGGGGGGGSVRPSTGFLYPRGDS